MRRDNQIIAEKGPYWVKREGKGHYTLWENVGTHSVRRATGDFKNNPDKALAFVMKEMDRRWATCVWP